MALAKSSTYGGLHFGKKDVADAAIEIVPTSLPVTWKLKVTRPGGGNLQEDPVKKVMEVEDLILVVDTNGSDGGSRPRVGSLQVAAFEKFGFESLFLDK